MRYKFVRTESVERKYECTHCRCTGDTLVRAYGEGRGFRRGWLFNDDDEHETHEEAAMAVQDDASRILGLVRCPACGRRESGAVAWSIARLMFSMVIAVVITAGIILLEHQIWEWPWWTSIIMATVGFAIGAHNEWRRWSAARHAARKLTKIRVAPEAPPVAIARVRPPTEPRKEPIPRVRTEAPSREPAPPSSDEGPRFLRERQ